MLDLQIHMWYSRKGNIIIEIHVLNEMLGKMFEIIKWNDKSKTPVTRAGYNVHCK